MNRVFSGLSGVVVSATILVASGCGGGSAASLSKALPLVEEGNYEKALPLLEEAAKVFPESATAWCNLGVCYLETGNTAKAIKALKTGVELASGSAEAYEHLARAYMEAGALDDARDVLVTASAIDPGNPRILTAIGVVEMKAGNLKPAFASTMEALDYDTAYAPALYNIAVLYRDQIKNRKLAERFFRRFISAAPSDPRAKEAQSFLAPQASATDSPAKSLVEKAKRHMQQDDYDTALVVLKDAMRKDPGYSEAIWNMAVMTDQIMGDKRGAAELYDAFQGKFPNDKRSAQAKRRVTELKVELVKAAAAAAAAQDAEELEAPEDPVSVSAAKEALAAGVEWQKKGDLAKAEAFYKKAIELDGTMAEGFYNLGLLYYKTKNLKGASTALSTAVSLRGDYVNARYMLANTQYELGDKASAAQNLNGVLLKDPSFAKAHYLLGIILHENNQLKASKIHFDRYALLTGRAAE